MDNDFAVTPREYRGRAEYCLGGEWKVFCTAGVDLADAMVFCRQIGFPSIGKALTLEMSQQLSTLICVLTDGFVPEFISSVDFSVFTLIERALGSEIRTLYIRNALLCNGDEDMLSECPMGPEINCGIFAGLGISCPVPGKYLDFPSCNMV